MKEQIYKIFHPKNLVIFLGTIIIVLSLTYLILFDKFNTPIAYVLYLVMSYSFVIICIKIYEIIKKIMLKIINSNEKLKKYWYSPKIKNRVSLFCSLCLNAVYVIFKLVTGVRYKSLWLISFSIYYLILVVTRISIAKEEVKKSIFLKNEYLTYRKTGIILLFINIFLAITILIVVNQKIMIEYSANITIAIAVYTFYLMINNIVNLIKYRKFKSPLMMSVKTVNVVTSLISMLSLEIAMLSCFGKDDIVFNETMIMATGGGISIIIIITSLYMIIKSTEWVRNNENM